MVNAVKVKYRAYLRYLAAKAERFTIAKYLNKIFREGKRAPVFNMLSHKRKKRFMIYVVKKLTKIYYKGAALVGISVFPVKPGQMSDKAFHRKMDALALT